MTEWYCVQSVILNVIKLRELREIMTELFFNLHVKDDWPPVSKEGLHFEKLDEMYKVSEPPFFIKDLSVGDIISVVLNNNGEVVSWKMLTKSAHSTMWIMVHGNASIEVAIEKLKNYKCNIEELIQFSYFSVDIPPIVSMKLVEDCFVSITDDMASLAFPSFRHK